MLKFNCVNFCIMGIPAYFFCALLAFVISICAYIMLISYQRYNLSQSVKTLLVSFVGMAFGAKLFGFLTGIYRCLGLGIPITIDTLFDTGIVYYGGLLGLLATYSLCIKSKHSLLDFQVLNVLSVCIPLFHTISRIGCFLSGCCYGKVYHGILAINYTTAIEGNIDVHMRFPVQLVEALFEFFVFLYLLFTFRQNKRKSQNLLFRYLTIYSIGRFFLEFFRGDFRRGVICGVSFSQCISILIWVVLISYSFINIKRLKTKQGDCNG